MRKLLALGVGIVGLVGCDFAVDGGSDVTFDDSSSTYDWNGPPTLDDDSFLRYESGLWGYQVAGFYMPGGDRDWGVAGLSSLTCQYYLSLGYTGTDEDVNNGSDDVEDGENDDNQGDDGETRNGAVRVLVASGLGEVQIVEMPSGSIVDSFRVDGRVASRFDGHGNVISLVDDETACHLSWEPIGLASSFRDQVVPSTYCEQSNGFESFAVDTAGNVWLPGPSSTAIVDVNGVTEIATGGDLVAVDPTLGITYLATTGGTVVSGVSSSGRVEWALDLGERIVDLDDRGPLGQAVVTSERDDGDNTTVSLIDGLSGTLVAETGVKRDPSVVEVSDDGLTVALHNQDQLDVFSFQDPTAE
jgi:hypothetical protein